MEKISWTNHVRNEEVLFRVNEQRNILHEIRKWKANGIGHILHSNCLLKHVIEGKIKQEMEVLRIRGRRRKKLLDDLKERRGYSHLKEEALDRAMLRNRSEGGFGPVVRQNMEWMNSEPPYIPTQSLISLDTLRLTESQLRIPKVHMGWQQILICRGRDLRPLMRKITCNQQK
jgi:hypothetical protein